MGESTHVGLTDAQALHQGGTALGDSAEQLRAGLQSLVTDLESDGEAMQGASLHAFAQAKAGLFERFDALVAFCRANGVRLTDGQQQVDVTDEGAAALIQRAGGSFDSLPIRRL